MGEGRGGHAAASPNIGELPAADIPVCAAIAKAGPAPQRCYGRPLIGHRTPPAPAPTKGFIPMSRLRTAALGASLLFSLSAQAEVIRFEVLQSGPAFEGRSFGSVSPYLKITSRATSGVHPADPRNSIISDTDKAPRDERSLFEAAT